MRCPECDHENTEGAWLCINCGEKLPRPETEEAEQEPVAEAAAADSEPEEPSRFAPKISENLRRLRDQTERERTRRSPRRGPRRVRTAGPSVVLGVPVAVWAIVAFLFLAFIFVVSSLQ